jgi:hypothetical protein
MVRTFVVILLAAALQAGVIQKLRLSDVGPPPSSEEVRSLLSSICPHGIVADPTFHGVLGCETCPEFTSAPDWTNWSLVEIYHGHFTDPATEEAAVATSGCEPHSMKWGGARIIPPRWPEMETEVVPPSADYLRIA